MSGWTAQWPKNSQSRMIIGIGTPSNHSRIPCSIISSRSCVARTTREETDWFLTDFGISDSAYQWPVFGIEDHGSAGGFGSPFCNSSIECRSGERTKAMLPSRGGRLMVTPIFISLSQVA
jgi:hypothetical protein